MTSTDFFSGTVILFLVGPDFFAFYLNCLSLSAATFLHHFSTIAKK